MQAAEYSADVFARNLRMQRAGMDISQRELAEKAGVDVTTVHKYEDGAMTPGADKLFAICEALGCSPNVLMGWGKR